MDRTLEELEIEELRRETKNVINDLYHSVHVLAERADTSWN